MKRGSALLTVLLISAIASGIILIGAREVLQNSRAGARQEDSLLALEAAHMGIEEGKLRYDDYMQNIGDGNTNERGLFVGEYGEGSYYNATQLNNLGSTGYSLKPLRRGFSNTMCTTWSDEHGLASTSANYQEGCPFFDLAVHRSVELDFSQPQGSRISAYFYGVDELPTGVGVDLNIKRFTIFDLHALFAGGVGQVDMQVCDGYSGVSGAICSPVTTIGNNQVYTVPPIGFVGIPKMVRIKVTSGTIDSLFVQKNSIPGKLVIDKGYTTIEAVGHSGVVQRRLDLTIHDYQVPFTPTLTEETSGLSAQGW
jgi:hypothetical protein